MSAKPYAEKKFATVNGKRMAFTQQRRIEDLPLAEMGVDLVIDCTGAFKTEAAVQPYYDAGVKKVVISAPVKDEAALNLVIGVNDHLYDGSQNLVTAASCTTNCLAPVVKVLLEGIGIKHGSMTTIHANSARDGVSRLENMIAMAGIEMPLKAMRSQISSAVNLIVQASRLQDGSRRMT